MSNPRPVGGRLVSAAILFFAPLAVPVSYTHLTLPTSDLE